MRILTRYLLRTYIPTFLLCLGIFLFVLLMNYFLRLFNMAVMKGISLSWILLCFARLSPYFLSLSLPMAFLVALLLTLGHFSENGEALALRSAGFSFKEILAPYLVLAVVLSGLLVYINHKASPEGFHSFRDSYDRAAAELSHVTVEPRILTRVCDWEIYAEGSDEEAGRLRGVRLIKRQGDYKRLRVMAPEGSVRMEKGRGLHLELRDGALLWPNDEPASRTSSTFRRYKMFSPIFDNSKFHRELDIQEMNTPRLLQRAGDPATEPSRRREYATEGALRSAGAAAPFVLFWVACPLGLRSERRTRAVSFALSLLVLFVYYGLLALGMSLGRRHLEWSSWGPWIPDVVCLGIGGGLWWRGLRQ
jgi:lipopolysaccharide export LptBFGC system permease protein LptF